MSEQTQRKNVVNWLKELDAVAVENRAYPGTPDVNYIGGWIELKWLRRFPRHEPDIVRIEHFTPQQRVWLMRRVRRGGKAWLLLQVGLEWFLFDGEMAAKHVGHCTRSALHSVAYRWTDAGMTKKRLIEWLTSES